MVMIVVVVVVVVPGWSFFFDQSEEQLVTPAGLTSNPRENRCEGRRAKWGIGSVKLRHFA